MSQVQAKLFCERSAGAIVVGIYADGVCVWSHDYFAFGCSNNVYKSRMSDAWQDMLKCPEFRDFDGCDLDDNLKIVDPEDDGNLYHVATVFVDNDTKANDFEVYCTEEELSCDGMATDFFKTNKLLMYSSKK